MKSPKSSHTEDPLAAVLISYLGKDTRLPKTPGNLNGTYNTPKLYSRSTNNGGTSKKGLSCVVQALVFSSRLSLFLPRSCGANLCVFELPFLCHNMSSSSNSSSSHPGPFDSQQFHRVFPATLPR